MTADSQWAVQSALYDSLCGDSQLISLLKNGAESIFDAVPDDAALPCLVMAGMRTEAFETQAGGGMKILLSLESYSRYRGMRELKMIMQAVYDHLHGKDDLLVAGHHVIDCRFLSSRTLMDEDGLTRRAVQNFEILTEPAL
ncbi:MAG: DUF3168 domain-containing protein [Pseudomonadota bacterium]|jgi:hypothetical protein|nr:DUF3168 domain-containing protein [Pseudomonadota bacterium]QKK04376.1 MAG: DUF3168 domain-containing protein [Pseudomonadota bacterium]